MAEVENSNTPTPDPFRAIRIGTEPVNDKCGGCPGKDLAGAQCINGNTPFCDLHPDNLDPDSSIAIGIQGYQDSMQQQLKLDEERQDAARLERIINHALTGK